MSRRRASWTPHPEWAWTRTLFWLRMKTKTRLSKVERKPTRIPKWRRYRNLPNWKVAS